mmetsp:Transcript_19750/g.56692  ORF Transcript_19750/g.56692 Transcript_19750/m.56692 type:complete len:319 (-) Transcript_19750:1258-2214(-)
MGSGFTLLQQGRWHLSLCCAVSVQVGDMASQLQQLQPSHITSEASLRAARDVGYQMTLMASHMAAVTTQLALQRIPLASAVAALTASTADEPHQELHPKEETSDAAAPAQTQDEPPGRVPSYRLVFRSGNKPINEPPVLNPDNCACIFGSLQPWELARLRPAIGKHIFHQAAQQYTHLTIDSDDGETRGIWERMSCEMAHRWGQRSRNLKELTIRHPEADWCTATPAVSKRAAAPHRRQPWMMTRRPEPRPFAIPPHTPHSRYCGSKMPMAMLVIGTPSARPPPPPSTCPPSPPSSTSSPSMRLLGWAAIGTRPTSEC